jgi:hypothetical protein
MNRNFPSLRVKANIMQKNVPKWREMSQKALIFFRDITNLNLHRDIRFLLSYDKFVTEYSGRVVRSPALCSGGSGFNPLV